MIALAAAARRILEGVPTIGYDQHPDGRVELTPFPSALRACLTYLGEPWDYAYLMGTSGAAFRMTWLPRWEPDNVALHYIDADAGAPFQWAFDAVGWTTESLHDRDRFRDAIVASIDRGVPALAFGVVGPPEPSVIAGYDEGGDVLIGRSFFQSGTEWSSGVEIEPSGYFRARDWLPKTEAVVILREKVEPAPRRETYRAALTRALHIVQTPEIWRGRRNGLAAYDAWADQLLDEADFPADDLAALRLRQAVHNDAATMVAEGRWYGSLFLAAAADAAPFAAPELLAAASHHATEHSLIWDLWRLQGGPGLGDAQALALADPDIRLRSADLIREAREHDARAIDLIERALRHMS